LIGKKKLNKSWLKKGRNTKWWRFILWTAGSDLFLHYQPGNTYWNGNSCDTNTEIHIKLL